MNMTAITHSGAVLWINYYHERCSMKWFHKLIIIVGSILAFLIAVVGGSKW